MVVLVAVTDHVTQVVKAVVMELAKMDVTTVAGTPALVVVRIVVVEHVNIQATINIIFLINDSCDIKILWMVI